MKFTASIIGFLYAFTFLTIFGVIAPEMAARLAIVACAAHWAALLALMTVKTVRRETKR